MPSRLPLRGASHLLLCKEHRGHNVEFKMACQKMASRDGDCFLCRRVIFYWHNSRANSLQTCMRIFGKFWHKILNISRPCGQILMKSCSAGAKTQGGKRKSVSWTFFCSEANFFVIRIIVLAYTCDSVSMSEHQKVKLFKRCSC